jgi:hypothetical protein
MGVVWGAGRVRAAIAVALLASAAPGHADTFVDLLGRGLLDQRFAEALSQQVARSIPVPSASAGVSYVETDDPLTPGQRVVSLAGQLYLERPETVGRRRWNVSLAYQRVRIDTLEGDDIRDLRDVDPPACATPSCGGGSFTIPHLSIDLAVDQLIAGVTYGLTDDLEVNLTVPVLSSELDFDAVGRLENGFSDRSSASSSKVGVGDLLARTKWRFLEADRVRAAAGLGLRMPTGEEENFQGTGDTELSPQLSLAADVGRLGRVRLVSNLNAAVDANLADGDRSQARWGLGLEVHAADAATVALAVLGRHPFSRVAPPGFFDLTRCLDPACTRTTRRPLLGLTGERADFYDFSAGVRVNLWRHWLIGFANAIVPLNRDGFRADVIPLAGIEAVLGRPG